MGKPITHKEGTVLYCQEPTCPNAALGETLKLDTTRAQFVCGYQRKINVNEYKPKDEVDVFVSQKRKWQRAVVVSLSTTNPREYNVRLLENKILWGVSDIHIKRAGAWNTSKGRLAP